MPNVFSQDAHWLQHAISAGDSGCLYHDMLGTLVYAVRLEVRHKHLTVQLLPANLLNLERL